MNPNPDSTGLPRCGICRPAGPLWQIVPVRDNGGRSLADFMLLVPRMRSRGAVFAEYAAQAVRRACRTFDGKVFFAELNQATGVIWVSVLAEPGLCARVASAIRIELPEALLVGGQLGVVPGSSESLPETRWLSRMVRHIHRRVVRRLLPCPPDNAAR